MKDNEKLISVVKEMETKSYSSRFLLWNNEHWNKHKSIVEENDQKECCSIYQTDPNPLDERTKYLWVCVNAPVEKLLYIVEVVECVKKMPENPNCGNEDCFKDAKKFNERKDESYKSKKICICS